MLTWRLFANRHAPAHSWGALVGLRVAPPSERRRGKDGERAADVLVALSHGPQTAREIAERTGITRQAAQYHLTRLRAQGKAGREGASHATRWRLP